MYGSGLAVAVGDRLDLQPLAVEDDLLGVGLALDVERRRAADPLGVEIDPEVERDMMDPRFLRPGVAGGVDGIGAGQDRRDAGALGGLLVGGGGDDVGAFAGGKQQQRPPRQAIRIMKSGTP